MGTAHSDWVNKVICPICSELQSTEPNLKVRFGRKHADIDFDKNIKNRVRCVWVHRSNLMNCRYYGQYDSSGTSDEEAKISITELAEKIGLQQFKEMNMSTNESQPTAQIDFICSKGIGHKLMDQEFNHSDPLQGKLSQESNESNPEDPVAIQPLQSIEKNSVDCSQQLDHLEGGELSDESEVSVDEVMLKILLEHEFTMQ